MTDYSVADANSDPVKVVLKWFSPKKGFGFVIAPDGGRDIFLHISVVSNAGHDSLPDGTTLVCTLGNGQKGQEVKQIISVDTSTATPNERSFGGGGFGGGFDSRPPRRPRDEGFGGGGRRHFEDRGAPSGPAKDLSGTVKWYNSQKGFGFIMPEDGSRDVFVHMSALRRSGLQTLDEGQNVRMRVVNGAKGQEAESVEIV